jgi:hypothetical protein
VKWGYWCYYLLWEVVSDNFPELPWVLSTNHMISRCWFSYSWCAVRAYPLLAVCQPPFTGMEPAFVSASVPTESSYEHKSWKAWSNYILNTICNM